MGITLGEILEWDILAEARIVTDTFNRATQVENITIMEAPDIGKWIDGNNIVLTGLYSIYEDKRKTAEFLQSLQSGRVCALFIKINRFVDAVPPSIIEAGQALGIAVVEMPGHIRYIDILYPVIAAIFDSRVVQLGYYKETLGALTGPALGNKGMGSIVQAFAGIVKNPVALYDAAMKCLCATDDAFARVASSEPVEEGRAEGVDYTVHRTRFAGGEEEPLRRLLVPIRVFGQTKATLSIVEQQHPMTELDFIALENAVTVLSFELVKDFAEEEVEGRFKQEIVEDIRQRRNLDTLKDRLSGIGIATGALYNVLLIEMPATTIGRTPAIVKQQLVNHHEAKVFDLYLAAKKKLRMAGFESLQGNTITAFIEQPGANAVVCETLLKTLCETLLEQAAQALPDFPLHIGYTTTFTDIVQATGQYNNAQGALHVSRLLYGPNTHCNYDKLGVYKLLCLARDKEELEACVPAAVKALSAYQSESGLPLVETLAAYFEHGGNVQQTARALFVHYKTLHYRLHKIETVAGVNLKNSTEALELQMGLYILRMLQSGAAAGEDA